MGSSAKLLYLILAVCVLNLGLFAYTAGTLASPSSRERLPAAPVNTMTPPSNAASPMERPGIFMAVEGIQGNIDHEYHEDWIEIISLATGIGTPGSSAWSPTSGARMAERVEFQEVSIVKYVDSSSTGLIEAAAKGTHIGRVRIDLFRSSVGGEPPIRNMRYELKDVIVTSVKASVASNGDRMVEEVTLSFDVIRYTYTETDPRTGASIGDSTFGWSVMTNSPV